MGEIHEAGHLFAAKKIGVRVEAFSLGMGKRLFGAKIGDTDYRVSLIPFGGYCKMAGDEPDEAEGREYEFGSKPAGHRFWVLVAGSLSNYIFAFLIFWVVFMIGVPVLSSGVGQILNGYPAQKAGLKVGDRILSINETKVEYWDDLVETIQKESTISTALEMIVDRDGKIIAIDVIPEINEVTNIFGQKIRRPMIGIAPQSEILTVSYGPIEAFYHGGGRLLSLTGMTYKGIWLLVTGGLPVKKSVSGPIGIGFLIGQAAKLGLVPLLVITAHISMALAVFNLLPFPVLDGGHVIFLGFERLRGRPLSIKTQEIITQAALILLIAFALFVSWQDIIKFTPFGGK